jgi:hypothetical protein
VQKKVAITILDAAPPPSGDYLVASQRRPVWHREHASRHVPLRSALEYWTLRATAGEMSPRCTADGRLSPSPPAPCQLLPRRSAETDLLPWSRQFAVRTPSGKAITLQSGAHFALIALEMIKQLFASTMSASIPYRSRPPITAKLTAASREVMGDHRRQSQ